jgi:hypothetical protein
MQTLIKNYCSPLFLSVLLHALAVAIGAAYYLDLFPGTPPQPPDSTIIFLEQPPPTKSPNPNRFRLGFFLPETPVLARFPGMASRAFARARLKSVSAS